MNNEQSKSKKGVVVSLGLNTLLWNIAYFSEQPSLLNPVIMRYLDNQFLVMITPLIWGWLLGIGMLYIFERIDARIDHQGLRFTLHWISSALITLGFMMITSIPLNLEVVMLVLSVCLIVLLIGGTREYLNMIKNVKMVNAVIKATDNTVNLRSRFRVSVNRMGASLIQSQNVEPTDEAETIIYQLFKEIDQYIIPLNEINAVIPVTLNLTGFFSWYAPKKVQAKAYVDVFRDTVKNQIILISDTTLYAITPSVFFDTHEVFTYDFDTMNYIEIKEMFPDISTLELQTTKGNTYCVCLYNTEAQRLRTLPQVKTLLKQKKDDSRQKMLLYVFLGFLIVLGSIPILTEIVKLLGWI